MVDAYLCLLLKQTVERRLIKRSTVGIRQLIQKTARTKIFQHQKAPVAVFMKNSRHIDAVFSQ
jgi:hypothetical protein